MSWTRYLARIPRNEFAVTFSRSSGPGGQHVNKVNSRATIRLPRERVEAAAWLDDGVRARAVSPAFAYATKRGDWLVSSERTRSQPQNLDDCFEKLARELAKHAFVPAEPSPAARDRWKKLNKKEDEKRKEIKKRHAAKKQDRK